MGGLTPAHLGSSTSAHLGGLTSEYQGDTGPYHWEGLTHEHSHMPFSSRAYDTSFPTSHEGYSLKHSLSLLLKVREVGSQSGSFWWKVLQELVRVPLPGSCVGDGM